MSGTRRTLKYWKLVEVIVGNCSRHK